MGFNKRRMESERAAAAEKETAARRALGPQIIEDSAKLVEAWNARQAAHMPVLFSPTIEAAITAGYWFLGTGPFPKLLVPFEMKGWPLLGAALLSSPLSPDCRALEMAMGFRMPRPLFFAFAVFAICGFAESALSASDWQRVTDKNGESAAIDTETITPSPDGVFANICIDRKNEGVCHTSRVIFDCHGNGRLALQIFHFSAPPESLMGELAAIACAKR